MKSAARMVLSDRADSTRRRMALGGLVVKAGLSLAAESFLIGVLIEAARIAPGSAEHDRLKRIGELPDARDLA